jgi:S-methylmethionine-dependent homocysteine/selenocysteine methylase
MSPDEAAAYHALQARAFADAGAEMISAITMTYVEEAIGIARAARAVGLPSVIAFTVETDGRLPSGQPLGAAIEQVDEATGSAPAYFMVNCMHPTHLPVLDEATAWRARIRGVRANASRASHAELDAATVLDRGDVAELAGLYRELARSVDLCVVGGCCGTDDEHIAAIADAVAVSQGAV